MAQKNEYGIFIPSVGEWQSSNLSSGYIADYKPFNFVDGEGVRCSLYVSGCPFKCPGCYNKAAQSFRYGTPYTAELEARIFADLAKPYVAGLTFLGGEPFLNTNILTPLARKFRDSFGTEKNIWVWSGYTLAQILQEPEKAELLELCDVLVDGPFIQEKYEKNLAYRGSRNQRIIDLRSRTELKYD